MLYQDVFKDFLGDRSLGRRLSFTHFRLLLLTALRHRVSLSKIFSSSEGDLQAPHFRLALQLYASLAIIFRPKNASSYCKAQARIPA